MLIGLVVRCGAVCRLPVVAQLDAKFASRENLLAAIVQLVTQFLVGPRRLARRAIFAHPLPSLRIVQTETEDCAGNSESLITPAVMLDGLGHLGHVTAATLERVEPIARRMS